jgi:hypothetical protein
MAQLVQIQMRRDSAADWTTANPTLAAGEWGFETDTGLMKLGNGSDAWADLAYFAVQSVNGLVGAVTDVVLSTATATLTKGYTATAHDAGTVTTGTLKPAPADGNLQRYVNGGAHTLAAPDAAGDYTIVVQVTNNASAGVVTFSGFTLQDGDNLTTSDGDDFLLFITKVNGLTHCAVKALQ